MRRKTKPRVVWLPNDRTFAIDAQTTNVSTYTISVHDVVATAAGQAVVSFQPVVIDVPPDPLTAGVSLSDIESSGYRLRRIVGKIFCAVDQVDAEVGNNGPPIIICTAGFIILRVNPLGDPINTADVESYGPNIIDTNDSPWIWRRTWILANANLTQSGFGFSPSNNASFAGSIADGPHVDAKTARIVSQDERLFLVLSSTAPFIGDPDILTSVKWITDTRTLASMRVTSGNRRNASR